MGVGNFFEPKYGSEIILTLSNFWVEILLQTFASKIISILSLNLDPLADILPRLIVIPSKLE
jgi:hypothetical protein